MTTVVIDRTARTDRRVYDERPEGVGVSCIVLHHTGSTNEISDLAWLSNYHENPVSAHKLFKRDGTIIKIVPEAARAWHAGLSIHAGREDVNDFSLGYEICNDGHAEAYTDAQYQALAESIAYDCALYHIPDSSVTTHKAVRDAWRAAHPGTAERKYDPFGLDIDRIWRDVWTLRANWPAGWPARWVCSGGHA